MYVFVYILLGCQYNSIHVRNVYDIRNNILPDDCAIANKIAASNSLLLMQNADVPINYSYHCFSFLLRLIVRSFFFTVYSFTLLFCKTVFFQPIFLSFVFLLFFHSAKTKICRLTSTLFSAIFFFFVNDVDALQILRQMISLVFYFVSFFDSFFFLCKCFYTILISIVVPQQKKEKTKKKDVATTQFCI